MLDSLVTRKSSTTLPILPVDEAAFTAWKRKQGKARRRWLDRSEFVPRGNRVLVLPGPRGPALALLGTGDRGPWPWAGAAQRLPPGRYRIDVELTPEDATNAAVGWALQHYAFRRYKSGEGRKRRELVWPKGADRAEVRRRVSSIGLARDLVNTPAEDLGPAELAETARELGLPAERRPFRAHVTLARARQGRVSFPTPPPAVPPLTLDIGELTLFSSRLEPSGARYTVQASYPLARESTQP